MKKIECIIRHKAFPMFEESVRALGIHGMTVSEVKGFGNEQTRPDPYLFLPKVKVEIYACDEDVEKIVEIAFKICRTGQLGDGKIAVFEIQDLIRIRTGERGEVAI